MTVLDQISFYQNRRDEGPNQELARQLAAAQDQVGIQEISDLALTVELHQQIARLHLGSGSNQLGNCKLSPTTSPGQSRSQDAVGLNRFRRAG